MKRILISYNQNKCNHCWGTGWTTQLQIVCPYCIGTGESIPHVKIDSPRKEEPMNDKIIV